MRRQAIPCWIEIAPIAHYGFYVLVVLMVATGYATGILAGLPAIVFGGSGAPLPPTFTIYPTFVAHGYIAALLVGFIILHVLAAFYHQFIRRDRLFRRMFFGRRSFAGPTKTLTLVAPMLNQPDTIQADAAGKNLLMMRC